MGRRRTGRRGLRCTMCWQGRLWVVWTLPSPDALAIVRSRKCDRCGAVVRTTETVNAGYVRPAVDREAGDERRRL